MNCCCTCLSGLVSILYFLSQTITILVMMPDIFTSIGFGSIPITENIVYVWLLLNDFLIVSVWLSLQFQDPIMNFVCTNLPDCDEQTKCCGRDCELCMPCSSYSRFVSKRKTCTKIVGSLCVALS